MTTARAHRQILTLNETHIFNPKFVNEARLGFNRIGITFAPNVTTDPTSLGLGTGTTGMNGIPQITISDIGINFGGPSGFPQGRTDTLGIFSDAATYLTGKHAIKIGGEFRRFLNVNFTQDTGTIGFNSVANFQAGLANSFSIQPTNINSRIYQNALGAFVQDTYKIVPTLTLELGFRFEWNGSPVEGANRFVVFDPGSLSLLRVNSSGLGASPYKQNYNYEPRVGFSYDPFGTGKTVLRAAYGYMADQPETNVASGLASNPPFSSRVTYSSATVPIPFGTLYTSAAAPESALSNVQRDLKNAYTQTFNANIQHEIFGGIALSLGYYGSVGRHLRNSLNINQPNAAGVRPFLKIAASSPIAANASVSGVNISQVSSASSSNYNAMWFTPPEGLPQRSAVQLQLQLFQVTRSQLAWWHDLPGLDQPSLRTTGKSDSDTRHRIAAHAIYRLPFERNRLVQGFQFSGIAQWQTGNPLNVTTTSTFTGTSACFTQTCCNRSSTPRIRSARQPCSGSPPLHAFRR